MCIIQWDSDNNNSENFNKIRDWLAERADRKFRYGHISGIQSDSSTGKEEVLSKSESSLEAQNLSLSENALIFYKQGKSHKIAIKKMELDSDNKTLKIFSDDPHRYIFTEITSRGVTRKKIF
jgi:hypothetical protein